MATAEQLVRDRLEPQMLSEPCPRYAAVAVTILCKTAPAPVAKAINGISRRSDALNFVVMTCSPIRLNLYARPNSIGRIIDQKLCTDPNGKYIASFYPN